MTNFYSPYNLATGMFTGSVLLGHSHHLDLNTPEGCSAMLGQFDHLSQKVDLVTHEVVDYVPPQPENTEMFTWTWDTTTKRWVQAPTLAALRKAKWEEIKAHKQMLDTGSFSHDGKVYSIDKPNITGGVVDAMLAKENGEPYNEPWLLVNNTVVFHDADQMIALGRAMKAYVTNLVVIGETLRAQINSATVEQLETITWPAI